MMPQRIVINRQFFMSLAAFASLTVANSYAQTVIESAPTQQATSVQNRNIEVQPVVVSPAMEPNRVPRNEAVQIDGAEGVSVQGAATGVEGDNPGNANTGGVQVQNVTVQANPEMAVDNNGYSTVDSLRQRRRGVEVDNEARLLEKIEEDRLRRERERREKVEGIDGTFSGGSTQAAAAVSTTQDVPVIAVAAAGAPAAQPVAVVSTEKIQEAGGTKIAITPFGGQKWIYDSDAVFSAYNWFTTGVNLEGRISSWFGVEGSVGFSRDEFEYNGYYLPYDPYAQAMLMDIKTRDTWEVGANAILGPNYKRFRPYGIVGLGVIYQKYDVDGEYNEQVMEATGIQRATNHFFTNFGGGIDYRISKNFGIGGRVDYQYLFGDTNHMMNYHFGDVADRLRYVGNLQLIF